MSATSYLDCAPRTADGGRRRIDIVDQTLRDGPQSWWGMRLRKDMGLPIAAELDRTGFHTIDLVGSSIFEVLVRHCHEDRWDQLISLSHSMPRTTVRAGVRSNGIVTFGLTADSVMDLWVQRLCAHGIGSFWIYDGLFNTDKIGRLVKTVQAQGGQALPCILYADSPYHTDEYYAARTRELAALGADGIELEDAAGLLTPERTHTLVAAIKAAAGDLPVEIHFHSNNALAPLNYLEGLLAGADRVHSASRPLAAGVSLPSTEVTVANLRYAGFDVDLDESRFAPVEQHLLRVAEYERLPVGQPAEYALFQYRHQLPGGMAGTFRAQLRERGMEDRFEEVLDEMSRVREELGYPVMATPFSQLVGTQAVLNVVTGTRERRPDDPAHAVGRRHLGLRPVPRAPGRVAGLGRGGRGRPRRRYHARPDRRDRGRLGVRSARRGHPGSARPGHRRGADVDDRERLRQRHQRLPRGGRGRPGRTVRLRAGSRRRPDVHAVLRRDRA